MPRDGAGVYSLPNGSTATPNTTVLASQHNTPLADIAVEMTASLPRSGAAPMLGPLTLAADPTAALHAATKQYVDALSTGLDIKPSVRCATTANITLSGEQTLDGVLTSGSRVLVKNQSTASQNGIYVSGVGSWARAVDMDAWTEVPGAWVWVEQGTTQGDTGWVCTSDQGGTIGTTAINWQSFSGVGGSVAKSGDTMTGNLTIQPPAGAVVLFLKKFAAGVGNFINSYTINSLRWQLVFGGNGAESGANAGSDFALNRFADDGTTLLGASLSITRSSGAIATDVRPTFAGNTPWDTGNKPAIGAPDFWARYEVASGTPGGGYTAGADQQLTLNTIKRNVIPGASLVSNQVPLPAGTYYARYSTYMTVLGLSQLIFRNVSDGVDIERGMIAKVGVGTNCSFVFDGHALFTLAAAKTIEMRIRGTSTRATDGLGEAASFGTEVYRELEIWKL